MNKERVIELLTKDFTLNELEELSSEEFLVACWGIDGLALVKVCKALNPPAMSRREFISHCTACGGNWCGMYLTGIIELYPLIWDLIPSDMGIFSFAAICELMNLLNIEGKEGQ